MIAANQPRRRSSRLRGKHSGVEVLNDLSIIRGALMDWRDRDR